MNHHIKTFRGAGLALLVSATLLGACSTQQAYNTGQAWRESQCNRLTDMQDRQRCMKEASQPYDNYQKDVEVIKK